METLRRYLAFREDFYKKLDDVRSRMDDLLARLEANSTIQDLALLEAYHAENQQLFQEFLEIENELIEAFLKERGSPAAHALVYAEHLPRGASPHDG